MAENGKRAFVLVHGAWHGGWCWRRVADRLQAAGHRVFTPTLTGLADRSHLMSATLNLDTHIADVTGLFQWEEIDDAVLVGHSYAGWVVSGAVERIAERVSAIVYLDAFLPENGQKSYDLTSGPNRVALDAALARGDVSRPAPSAADFGLTDPADIAWVEPKLTPQPVGVSMQPLILTGARDRIARKLYIRASSYEQPAFDAALAKCKAAAGWRTIEMPDCSHDVMVDAAPQLTAILQEIAA